MTIEFTLPEMNTDNKSVKDLIIIILADHWPLTLKEIHNHLKKNYSINVSYQAVHKTINELKNKNILDKNRKEYQLNIGWIKSIAEFGEKLEGAYQEKKPLTDKIPSSFTVKNAWELYPLFIDLFERDVFNAKGKSICFIGNQVWNPMMGSEKEIEAYQRLSKKYQFYLAVRKNNLLNKMWKTYWDKINVKVKLNCKIGPSDQIDIFIVGDFFIQVFYPRELIKQEDRVGDKIKKISDVNAKEVNDIYFESYGDINIIITKNAELASFWRKKVEDLF